VYSGGLQASVMQVQHVRLQLRHHDWQACIFCVLPSFTLVNGATVFTTNNTVITMYAQLLCYTIVLQYSAGVDCGLLCISVVQKI
jgi:hypothetical protein